MVNVDKKKKRAEIRALRNCFAVQNIIRVTQPFIFINRHWNMQIEHWLQMEDLLNAKIKIAKYLDTTLS